MSEECSSTPIKAARKELNKFADTMSFKAILIVVLILLMMIPQVIIEDLVQERQQRSQEAESKISNNWGGKQFLQAPLLSMRFSKPNSTGKEESTWGHCWPENLTVTGEVSPSERKLGIFPTIVYTADLDINASFKLPQASDFGLDSQWKSQPESLHISYGISDVQGLNVKSLQLNSKELKPQPGIVSSARDLLNQGFHFLLTPQDFDSKTGLVQVSTKLALGGSRSLKILPCGRNNDIQLQTSWQDLGCSDGFLPQHAAPENGVRKVSWTIQDLQRSFRQHFTELSLPETYIESYDEDSGAHMRTKSSPKSCSVELIQVNNSYQRIERVVKYALLFICFTFAAVFICERISGYFIHPLQYLLTGIASLLFFVILLSLSEHLSFNTSYAITSLLITSIISAYTRGIFHSWKMTGIMASSCNLLYLYLFSTLQLEDYALLTGSAGLTLVICVVMYLTRNLSKAAPMKISSNRM